MSRPFWKSAMGKKLISKRYKAAFLIAFVVILGYPAYALPIKNIQSTTSCDIYSCASWVDLTTLGLNTPQINNIKSMNLTKFLPKVEQYTGLIDIAYNITGNVLYITGHINDNVYWTMDLGTYVTLDPWWNYTVNYYRIPNNASAVLIYPMDENTGTVLYNRGPYGWNAALVTSPVWDSGKYDYGINFTGAGNKRIAINNTTMVDKDGGFTMMMWIKTTDTVATLFDNYYAPSPSGHLWELENGIPKWYNKQNSAWVTATLSINDNTWHHIAVAYNKTNSSVAFYKDGVLDIIRPNAASLSIPAAAMTKTIGWSTTFTNQLEGKVDEFKYFNVTLNSTDIQAEMNTPINYSTIVNVTYTTQLFLNGLEGNITISPTQSLNTTATTNMTGLNVSIYNDSTLINSSFTTAYWNGTLALGVHNITATFSNSSTNATVTHWVTVEVPSNTIIDTHICFKTKPVCVDTLTNRVYINGVQQ